MSSIWFCCVVKCCQFGLHLVSTLWNKENNILYFGFPIDTGAFAGLCFLALYLSGKINVFDRRGHVAKLCISFLPLLVASLVAVSRVDDYRHHWEDVFAGGLIGLLLSSLAFPVNLQFIT